MSNQQYDLIISGGGVVGQALAVHLCQATQLKIALIEANPQSENQTHGQFDARVIALAKASQSYLKELGLSIDDMAAPIEQIEITDAGHLGLTHLTAKEMQTDALGYVVELAALGERFYQHLSKVPKERLHWFSPDKIDGIVQRQDEIEIQLQSGQSITASLLVVAEGAQGGSKSLLKMTNLVGDYNQSALIANVALSEPQQHIAYERFTQTGPLALLPMQNASDHQAQFSLVWTLLPEQAKALQAVPEADFLAELQQQFGYRAGCFKQVGQRDIFPLKLVQATNLIHHRAVLIGNSAQSLHPIAGQGLNLGLRDVRKLAAGVINAFDQQQDIGSYATLSLYAKGRKADRQTVVTATDFLARGFANDYWPLVIGRNLGLLALTKSKMARRQLANRAMGYTGVTQ